VYGFAAAWVWIDDKDLARRWRGLGWGRTGEASRSCGMGDRFEDGLFDLQVVNGLGIIFSSSSCFPVSFLISLSCSNDDGLNGAGIRRSG
jgi:hypothetical protein